MGLFGSKDNRTSYTLFEVTASSVGAAYLIDTPTESQIVYATRVPIVARLSEPPVDALMRSFNMVSDLLVRDGAPLLTHATGSGRSDKILIAVDAPWQETKIHTEIIDQDKPFTFTRSTLRSILNKEKEMAAGRILVDESVIATVLNGYEIKEPFGKRGVLRAKVITLVSSIEQSLANLISESVARAFHTRHSELIGASSFRYQSLRTLFPHENDYLFLDTAGSELALSLVRRGSLVAIEHAVAPHTDQWLTSLVGLVSNIAKLYPLPRMLFVLAPDAVRAGIVTTLSSPDISKLRYSSEPMQIIPVTLPAISDRVKLAGNVTPDLGLGLLAIFCHTCLHAND